MIVVEAGVEALDYLFATGKYVGRDLRRQPALVLLELKLPRMDGMEVLRRMRADARTATIPVVILSSSREERDLREAYRCGVNSYVCKPVDFAVFNEMARELSRYWLQLNEAPSLPGG
ncbi:MAG: response regulator [Thiohalomonadaceae bacterium]